MRYLLILLIIVGLLALAGCTGGLPLARKSAAEIAQQLVKEIIEILSDPNFEFPEPSSSPTEFAELALKFVYVAAEDRNDHEVFEWARDILEFIGSHFTKPATVTSATVVAIAEYEPGKPNGYLYFNVMNDPPSFVEKIYTFILKCETQNGTITSLSFPMITVIGQDHGYFYTVFLRETDSATRVLIYPIPSIAL